MIRRFNYTGRRKLAPGLFRIVLHEGPPRRFEISWDAETLGLPARDAGSRVYVEAAAVGNPAVQRFACGTVGAPEPPSGPGDLSELGDAEPFFEVKIVDERSHVGRLVAVTGRLRARGPGEAGGCDRIPILPVVPAHDMGERVWRVAFDGDQPLLKVNAAVPGILSLVKNDPWFFGIVFPEVIRQVLHHFVIGNKSWESDGDGDESADQWLRYAAHWLKEEPHPPQPEGGQSDEGHLRELADWIERVVDGFCQKMGTRENLVRHLEGGRP
jgi:hypothetical protein